MLIDTLHNQKRRKMRARCNRIFLMTFRFIDQEKNMSFLYFHIRRLALNIDNEQASAVNLHLNNSQNKVRKEREVQMQFEVYRRILIFLIIVFDSMEKPINVDPCYYIAFRLTRDNKFIDN